MISKKNLEQLTKKLSSDGDVSRDAIRSLEQISSIVAASATMTGNQRLSKSVAWGSLAISLATISKTTYDFVKKVREPTTYKIKVHESEEIFDVTEKWFMDSLPEEMQLSVYAHSSIKKPDSGLAEPANSGKLPPPTISYSFDGDIEHEMMVGKHKVTVFASTPEESSSGGDGKSMKIRKLRTVVIECKSIAARDDVLKKLEELAQKIVEEPSKLYVSTNWGSYRTSTSFVGRDINTVFLKDGQMDRLTSAVRSFKDNKNAYIKAGIPHRLGILLHGEPGSGKTSTATALASYMGMNVYVINVSGVGGDDNLGDLFERVPEDSIIILEDIDVAHGVKDRENDNGVTMAGMLNVLDGLQSPPGVVTIMTTNRLDVLDPAIIRPGRVDVMENLGCLDNKQLNSLCMYFMGHIPRGMPLIKPEDGISSAEVIGEFRKHLPDFQNASEDIVKFITQKVFTKSI